MPCLSRRAKRWGLVLLMAVIVAIAIIPENDERNGSCPGDVQPTTQAAGAMLADLGDMTKNPTINPINTAWTLVAAFLVF